MTRGEVAAAVFRRSESWLIDHMPADFPRPSADYGLFATEAVRAWVRKHFDLVAGSDPVKDGEDELLRRLSNGKRQGAPLNRSAA